MVFDWSTHPEADSLINGLLKEIVLKNEGMRSFMGMITSGTRTRSIDWIDHFMVPDDGITADLEDAGFNCSRGVWKHPDACFPAVITGDGRGFAIKVEDLDSFVRANEIKGSVEGVTGSRFRRVMVLEVGDLEMHAIERRGYDGFETGDEDLDSYGKLLEQMRIRNRDTLDDLEVLEELIRSFESRLDRDRISDAFFRSERRYWESRNPLATIQLKNQDMYGLGWGNHDHHTFRCSRENYERTISILESLGMEPRERFYAGEEAGWGAQVLEQKGTGITVFADVDMLPEERDMDFAHEGLDPAEKFGTVGLWVGLHGESILSAGLHHIAVLTDFERARNEGHIPVMEPFSNFPYLKQCFTEGEVWKVARERAHELLSKRLISDDQFRRFMDRGALGSHLEFIERNQGFKGFNRSSVSDIISRTDPRK